MTMTTRMFVASSNIVLYFISGTSTVSGRVIAICEKLYKHLQSYKIMLYN